MTAGSDHIVETLSEAFADLMAANPTAFRSKFRSMAQDPLSTRSGVAPSPR
jgi:hypothetical protein